eukprot:CAMPEP_0172359508 /NCGR_PEP_ID=MMETSP1060-20121228/3692_1 /TAXON_ID=37318 /ORGANISM="Pseudo-nitzschia pungens, Strain cf. cingulata" /LENGTH=198 /DNA_ID=CAMNT_0013081181 /DNA_START=361 /DNA_END=957 /DNA_ORIENTATION=+
MMMKIFATALALVAASPVVSAIYHCESETTFQLEDSVKPSNAAMNFLGTAMMESFNEAYKNNPDIEMISDKSESLGPASFGNIVTNLRGKDNNKSNLGGKMSTTYVWGGNWGCNLCIVDDDAALGSFLSADDFGVALATSSEHKAWEKLFCERAHQMKEFATMEKCAIVLKDCGEANDYDGYEETFVDQVAKLIKNPN